MNYIEKTNMLEMGGIEERAPRNWIPERTWRKYSNHSEISPQYTEVTKVTENRTKTGEISLNPMKIPRRNNKQGTSGEISRKNQYKTDYADESDSDMDF